MDDAGEMTPYQDPFRARRGVSQDILARQVGRLQGMSAQATQESAAARADYEQGLADIEQRQPQARVPGISGFGMPAGPARGALAQTPHYLAWEQERQTQLGREGQFAPSEERAARLQQMAGTAAQRLSEFRGMYWDRDESGMRRTGQPADAAGYRREMLRRSQVRDYPIETRGMDAQGMARARSEQLANITTAATLFNTGPTAHGLGKDLMDAIEGLKDAVVENTDITKDSSGAVRDLAGFTKNYSRLVGLEQEFGLSSGSMFRQRQQALRMGVSPEAVDTLMQPQMRAARMMQDHMAGAQATAAALGVQADPAAYAQRGNRFRGGWRGLVDRAGHLGAQTMQSMSGIGPMAYFMFAKYRIQSQMVEPYRRQVELGASEQMLAEQSQYAMSGDPMMDYEDSISQTISQRQYEMAQISAQVGQRTAGQYHVGFRLARSMLSDEQLANVMTAGQQVQNVAAGAAQNRHLCLSGQEPGSRTLGCGRTWTVYCGRCGWRSGYGRGSWYGCVGGQSSPDTGWTCGLGHWWSRRGLWWLSGISEFGSDPTTGSAADDFGCGHHGLILIVGRHGRGHDRWWYAGRQSCLWTRAQWLCTGVCQSFCTSSNLNSPIGFCQPGFHA